MLNVDRVRKDFGNVHAVRGISFAASNGVTFGLLGPNGAGKTTTMRMIVGILMPDAGSIALNGKQVDGTMRRRFGYLPEERGLYGRMKVRDQISYFGRLHGLTKSTIARRTDWWLERLGITEYQNRLCGELSKGNQQKVQVACAAVHEPELLVLDEPFTGLDPVNADMLLGILNELRAKGTTLILSSHQMWQLEHLCTTFCIIASGENRAAGTLATLRAEWPTRMLRVAPGTVAVRKILDQISGARYISSNGDTLDYQVPARAPFPEILRTLVNTDAIMRFELVEPSLQDIYLRAIRENTCA